MNRRDFLKKSATAGLSGGISLAFAEKYCRASIEKQRRIGGFPHNPIMIGYDNKGFVPDYETGFKLSEGDFITENKFISFQEAIKEIKKDKKRGIILNIGDSSTSGWNSNKVSRDSINYRSPFFSYPNYSDVLRAKSEFTVLNSGVPGYSSLQGRKQLRILLDKFNSQGIKIDFITVYLGNNDCTWNGNYEDRYQLPDSDCSPKLYLSEMLSPIGSYFNVTPRVTGEHYKKNLKGIIQLAKSNGSGVALIRPLSNLKWHPGLRSLNSKEDLEHFLKTFPEVEAKKELEMAINLYQKGKLKEAYCLDSVLPRIKPSHLRVLKEVSKETNTSLIDVQDRIKDGCFIDYCHPIGYANQAIAEEIIKIIRS